MLCTGLHILTQYPLNLQVPQAEVAATFPTAVCQGTCKAFAPLYAQGCALSCTYSNVIVHDRSQPWAYRYIQYSYHTSIYVR